ncbi:DUF4097 domain-containing protein [Tenacibaculum aiptasiae]|uniref:DUF4097 domain-containing protein n=1 Tax=Tenacibaculum aiptasiae TaxID=426481 RepID=A0A7J5ATB8_9FLAO|nr:DUF4097 family beta strand repeat-containing protein [Tenacibaculum aiptasiae]KAB1160794.1 DUF4097 domain-containing protein [Tenacibaculum aiptasiae]
MKRLLLFIGLLLTFGNLAAQKKVTKNKNASGINEVYIHAKFAKDIKIENWSKNEISVQATVNINDNKDNDFFSLKEDKIGTTYTIKSNYGDLFNKQKKHTVVYNAGDCKNCKHCSYHSDMKINYVIYVPKNIQLKIKSISGDVNALAYNGKLTLDLVSGNITIKKHSKSMNLKTVSGDIDIAISDAKFKAQTLTGTVYSNLDIDFDKNRKRSYGNQKIYGTVKNGKASLKLKTVSGDIFLRKI